MIRNSKGGGQGGLGRVRKRGCLHSRALFCNFFLLFPAARSPWPWNRGGSAATSSKLGARGTDSPPVSPDFTWGLSSTVIMPSWGGGQILTHSPPKKTPNLSKPLPTSSLPLSSSMASPSLSSSGPAGDSSSPVTVTGTAVGGAR